jgi:hypothetical protein
LDWEVHKWFKKYYSVPDVSPPSLVTEVVAPVEDNEDDNETGEGSNGEA